MDGNIIREFILIRAYLIDSDSATYQVKEVVVETTAVSLMVHMCTSGTIICFSAYHGILIKHRNIVFEVHKCPIC